MQPKQLDKLLRGVANKKRLEIVALLLDGRPRAVSDIAGDISLSFKSTSKHLHRMEGVGLLDRAQVGSTVQYRLVRPPGGPVRALIEFVRRALDDDA